jgi:putative endonuclease
VYSHKATFQKKVAFVFMASTYILYSSTLDKHYIGHTTGDLQIRIQKHLTDHSGFTSKAKDWILKWHKNFETKQEAYAMEREIKKLKSRKAIERLIKNS